MGLPEWFHSVWLVAMATRASFMIRTEIVGMLRCDIVCGYVMSFNIVYYLVWVDCEKMAGSCVHTVSFDVLLLLQIIKKISLTRLWVVVSVVKCIVNSHSKRLILGRLRDRLCVRLIRSVHSWTSEFLKSNQIHILITVSIISIKMVSISIEINDEGVYLSSWVQMIGPVALMSRRIHQL